MNSIAADSNIIEKFLPALAIFASLAIKLELKNKLYFETREKESRFSVATGIFCL
jgi:hypothetical protein